MHTASLVSIPPSHALYHRPYFSPSTSNGLTEKRISMLAALGCSRLGTDSINSQTLCRPCIWAIWSATPRKQTFLWLKYVSKTAQAEWCGGKQDSTVKDIMQQKLSLERARGNKHEAPDKQSPSFYPPPAPFFPIQSLTRIVICHIKRSGTIWYPSSSSTSRLGGLTRYLYSTLDLTDMLFRAANYIPK